MIEVWLTQYEYAIISITSYFDAKRWGLVIVLCVAAVRWWPTWVMTWWHLVGNPTLDYSKWFNNRCVLDTDSWICAFNYNGRVTYDLTIITKTILDLESESMEWPVRVLSMKIMIIQSASICAVDIGSRWTSMMSSLVILALLNVAHDAWWCECWAVHAMQYVCCSYEMSMEWYTTLHYILIESRMTKPLWYQHLIMLCCCFALPCARQ